MIPFKVIAFDLDGVIFDQSHANAIRHFGEVGMREAATYLNHEANTDWTGDLLRLLGETSGPESKS